MNFSPLVLNVHSILQFKASLNTGRKELIILIKWITLNIFSCMDDRFTKISSIIGSLLGREHSVETADVHGDRKTDLVLSNPGKNFYRKTFCIYMNRLIKLFMPPILYQSLNKLKPRSRYYSLNDLDKKMEKYLNYDNGFFVELGANDGISQSNTLYFERRKNWGGVLIEPTPHNYILCRKNRSAGNKIYCCACTSFDYGEKFVEIAYSNLMSAPIGLESDITDPMEHARTGKQFLNSSEDNFIFGALARPLNSLLIEADAPANIDFLSLDVEGAEIEVLKGIDHNRFRFKYMCIENRNKANLVTYLNTVGYDFIEQLSEQDYLFKDRNFPA